MTSGFLCLNPSPKEFKMQALHTKQPTENASHNLGRRELLCGIAAASGALLPIAAQASQAADNHDEMMMLIDGWSEHDERLEAVYLELDRIYNSPDRPAGRDGHVAEFLTEEDDYPISWLSREFCSDEDCDEFYMNLLPRKMFEPSDPRYFGWLERILDDWRRASIAMRLRGHAADSYFKDSGYDALEIERDALNAKKWAIEAKIFAVPCLSVRDVILKVQFVDRALEDPEAEAENLHLVVQSLKGLMGASRDA